MAKEGEVRLKGHVGRGGGKEARRQGDEVEALQCSRAAGESGGRQLCDV